MKLNPDCVRAVLIEIEKSASASVNERYECDFIPLPLPNLVSALPKYSKDDIYYTLCILDEAGLAVMYRYSANNRVMEVSAARLTYSGHELLNRIRDEKRWGSIKCIISSVRDYSLDAISAVSKGISSAAIEVALSRLENGFPIVSQ